MNITKDIESLSLVVQWDAAEDFIDTIYTVLWGNGSNPIFKVATVTEQTSYTITGLTLDTVYTITIAAANMCGDGPEYNTCILLSNDTTSTISATAAIDNLSATASPTVSVLITMITSSVSMFYPSITATTVNFIFTTVSTNPGNIDATTSSISFTTTNTTDTANVAVSPTPTAKVNSRPDDTDEASKFSNITYVVQNVIIDVHNSRLNMADCVTTYVGEWPTYVCDNCQNYLHMT